MLPKDFCESIFCIDLGRLASSGIKGLVIDLDNTLVAWSKRKPDPFLIDWFKKLRSKGFKCCIVSNNLSNRETEQFAIQLGASLVTSARKPFPRGFVQAMKAMGTGPSETAVIGDQLFTDVLGGNLAGTYTILVRPLGSREFPTTRLARLLEKLACRLFPKLRALTSQCDK
ncbi:MAG TPA: YqeG family HAD IIIA-type phosphatase [Firmicutes bacterium]|nr:YqeG family HAD IIIA-type phosphatase [Bacillota bacterium]